MTSIAVSLLLLSAALGFFIGLKYLLSKTFLPYQSQVAQKNWEELDGGVQAIILGMLRIIGGGFTTLAATFVWFSYAVSKHLAWAPWAILTIAILGIAPALYVAINLRSSTPRAKTPIVPLVAGLVLILLAVGFALAA